MAVNNKKEEKLEELGLEEQIAQDIADLSEYLKSLFDFFPAPTIYATLLGVILEANKALENVVKIRKEEIVGKTLSFLLGEKVEKEVIQKTSQKGEFKKQYNFSFKGRKKAPIMILTKLRVDEGGEPVGLFLTMIDMTKVKQAEEKLKEESIVLEIRVKARTRRAREFVESLEETVEEKTKELEDKLRDLQRFYRLTRGREGRFKELQLENIKLKNRVKELKGKIKKYELSIR